jgi:hypothetical protein
MMKKVGPGTSPTTRSCLVNLCVCRLCVVQCVITQQFFHWSPEIS